MCHKTMMGTCIIKENLIGQSGTILVGKVASNRGVEKSKCRRARHMERRRYKRGEKKERKRKSAENWRRREKEEEKRRENL